jgi:putative ABC transport system ATP-binding protein
MKLNDDAVVCRNVKKYFGEGEARIEALRGINFDAHFGEMTFLLGPSGCGKTTLISVIAGLLKRDEGDLSVLGTQMESLSENERVLFRRKNLGFIFQQYNLLPALTAAENVAVPLLATGVRRKHAVEQASELLSLLGLSNRVNSLPAKLSGGQQQRVAIARALIHEPRLVVCDEPTAALDNATGQTVMELLATKVLSPERAVIIVTHDSRVLHFADNIAHMDDGRIVELTRQQLQEAV